MKRRHFASTSICFSPRWIGPETSACHIQRAAGLDKVFYQNQISQGVTCKLPQTSPDSTAAAESGSPVMPAWRTDTMSNLWGVHAIPEFLQFCYADSASSGRS